MTDLAVQNNHQLPEMLTYINLWKKPVADYRDSESWCYCVRDKNEQYAAPYPWQDLAPARTLLRCSSTTRG
jgi:hypothetical protein